MEEKDRRIDVMLYGLNSEYGKYKKVCKSKKEQDYISWRNHILEKYIHTKASDRLNMEKYVNMKLRLSLIHI